MISSRKLIKQVRQRLGKPMTIVVLSIIGALAVSCLALASYTLRYKDRIYPNTTIGPIDFGGKTKAEAQALLTNALGKLPPDITITVNGEQEAKIRISTLAPDFNVGDTVTRLYAVGRSGSLSHSLGELLRSVGTGNNRLLIYGLDETKVKKEINEAAQAVGQGAENAKIIINSDTSLTISPDKSGNGIANDELEEAVKNALAHLNTSIAIIPHPITPTITADQLTPLLDDIKTILAKAPLTLVAADKKTSVDMRTLFTWLKFERNSNQTIGQSSASTSPISGIPTANINLGINFNNDVMKNFLTDFAKTVDQEPKNAKLKVDNSTVKIDTDGVNGQKLKIDAAITTIVTTLTSHDDTASSTITLPTESIDAKVQSSNLASLGLKEIIGHGETTFKGSPSNRIHNISTGAQFLNGALIAPGSEFSTLKTLGAIDGSTGYLPELVIKEDKTTPEFGGGLCQVSTTLFRSVLNAGLKVTARQNHAYRVPYYEPPVGLDATIYDPAPDFKFINDTGNYILLQSKVAGIKITFDLYGTKDGRSSAISDPVVTNITEPPAPEYINTDTLNKGETKQVEKAHQGATAVVVYTVTKDGKELFKQTFRSKYKAWQARYLVGTKEDQASPSPSPSPSSSPSQ